MRMRVGLVRHFPVEEPMPSGWLTARELHRWQARYDEASVRMIDASVDAGGFVRCWSSDLERARTTARAIWSGELNETRLLREPELQEFGTGRLLLPFALWKWVLRFSWLTGHRSQRIARDDFRKRVLAAADLIESEPTDILVVSHGGMMLYLSRELRRRGFRGPTFRIAEHGRLYLFET